MLKVCVNRSIVYEIFIKIFGKTIQYFVSRTFADCVKFHRIWITFNFWDLIGLNLVL